MGDSVSENYIYENLKPLTEFNANTKLCIYEPTKKLYIIKCADLSCEAAYRSIKLLNNRHLPKIYHIAKKEDRLEIVREYISGDTLADVLKGRKSLPEKEAVKIAADVCDGLSDIHKLGLVHRDINPNNIIISSGGIAKIIDFGITRSYVPGKTSDTAILGTPGYAAPEQFGFSQSDGRTDIYALGVLLNVMLTGHLPNEKSVKGRLGKIIKKCIEIDSRHRYNSIGALKSALFNMVLYDSPMDKAIKQIPGLRSDNAFVVVLAIMGYILLFIFTAGVFSSMKKGAFFPTLISWLLCFAVPFFCFHNFLDIWNKLPFSKGADKRNQRIVYTIIGISSIFIGIVLFGAINAK